VNNKLLLKVIIGSQAYNLAESNSDTDRRGVYLENPNQIFGLKKAEPSSFSEDKNDTIYPLKHFVSLLCNNNPNLLEMLYVKDKFIEHIDPLFDKYIMKNREVFISKKSYKSYLGYASHQIHLAEQNKRPEYSKCGYDSKSAMHICRLMIQLKNLIEFNNPIVFVDEQTKTFLMNVKWGNVFANIDKLKDWIRMQEITIKGMIDQSKIQDEVDYDLINNILINFYKEVY